VETSGPFLSMPVLLRVFPQGLDSRDPQQAARLREAYEDWLDRGTKQPSIHHAWIRHVLHELLGYPADWLAEGQSIPPGIQAVMANVGEVLRPDMVLQHKDAEGKPVLLVALYSPDQDLQKPIGGKLWKAAAGTRMMELLHASDLPLGLITNGEEWTLVSAPRGETTGFASWYADLWMQEPLTLRAFHSLLHLHRLVGVAASDTLPALFVESSKDQQEVTDQLGYQVRQAVEVLVQAFDRIDADAGRTLLSKVSEKQLYDSALTVMMRLVFLFSAEERGLLMLGDPLYDQNYAVSTLSALLREQADQHGEEVLERRHDAWCRLLSTFRAVHGGVEHEAMRLPPYGGTLFDPNRYPFLEGRVVDSSWRNTHATPLLINNRVVLHLLEALQLLRVRVPGGGLAEARRLSFRALDIEQIGHVYEGLLDHAAKRAVEPVLGLIGSKDKEPEIPLATLEKISQMGTAALVEFLRNETGRSERALTRLIEEPPAFDEHALLVACGQDERFARSVTPFAPFVREDSFGRLVIVPPGSIYVTAGSDRRSTGTHYTPRSLTKPIVKYALEPLVYSGPADGLPEAEWTLSTPKEILALKVCDMAMGSGAFLVETCRYLAERLVEAWENVEREHPGSFVVTPDGELSAGAPSERLIPIDAAERLAIARRYVADRCIYGVDINPMAVEMAKLGLWLATLQRDRPFTFLDHALKCGDSLVGVSSMKQIENFSLRAGTWQITFATADLATRLKDASAKRVALESLPCNDALQIETKSRLHVEAEIATAQIKILGDALIALELQGLDGAAYSQERTTVAAKAATAMQQSSRDSLRHADLQFLERTPFHWPAEFPEVFVRGGFDAFVGNPPFIGNKYWRSAVGEYFTKYSAVILGQNPGHADICAVFHRRAFDLANSNGITGLIGCDSLKDGDSWDVGLRIIASDGEIFRALSSLQWPGTATVRVSIIWTSKSSTAIQRFLDDKEASLIDGHLVDVPSIGEPHLLFSEMIVGGGCHNARGEALILTHSDPWLARLQRAQSPYLRVYVTGDDMNTHAFRRCERWCVYCGDETLDEVASRSAETLIFLKEHVRGIRTPEYLSKFPGLAKRWWQFHRPAADLYREVNKNSHSVVIGVVAPDPIWWTG
jgi:hypothetical protein